MRIGTVRSGGDGCKAKLLKWFAGTKGCQDNESHPKTGDKDEVQEVKKSKEWEEVLTFLKFCNGKIRYSTKEFEHIEKMIIGDATTPVTIAQRSRRYSKLFNDILVQLPGTSKLYPGSVLEQLFKRLEQG